MKLRFLSPAAAPLLACAFLAAACGSDPEGETEDPNAPVAKVEVTPSSSSIFEAKTVKLRAIARSASGKELSGREVVWTTHNDDIASVAADGLVTGLYPGLARITATVDGVVSAPAEIDVKYAMAVAVEIEPGEPTVSLGRTIQFQAVGRDADGGRLVGRQAFWSSSDPRILTIDAEGAGRALAEGEATIEAEVEGIKGTLAITVVQGIPARVEIEPATFSIVEAQTTTLTAKVLDEGGFEIRWPSLRWSSEDESIATVVSGMVTGERVGTVRIVATAGDASGSAQATITEAQVTSVRITTGAPTVAIGESSRLYANAISAEGPVQRVLKWESSDPLVASVDASGKVTGHALGTATITVSYEEHHAEAILETQVRLTKVKAGGEHACGLTPTAGRVICFGDNAKHQLGTVVTEKVGGEPVERTFSKTPVAVDAPADMKFVEVAAGAEHSCAIASDGAAWCWGSNEFGQLGNGDSGGDVAAPVRVVMPAGKKFTALSLGADFSCALTQQDGLVYCWGNDEDGRLGRLPGGEPSNAPGLVNTSATFVQISAGASHTCGVTTDSEAMCWGKNDLRQAGGAAAFVRYPSTVSFGTGGQVAKAVSAGLGHSCGLLTNGEAWCWGSNSYEQLGVESADPAPTGPVKVAGNRRFGAISAGGYHTCAITDAGAAYCWGANSLSQLGTGSAGGYLPETVRTGASFKSISSALFHNCSMSVGPPERAYCWGAADKGQLGRKNVSDPGAAPVDGQ